MVEFARFLANFFKGIFSVLNNATISSGNTSTSVGSILFACIVIGFVANLFWKGVKS